MAKLPTIKWAIGAAGSIARNRCESQPCVDCQELASQSAYDTSVASLPVLTLEQISDTDRTKYMKGI